MTRKEYAISLGLAKAGRGRMSKDAHAAIMAAEAEGMIFDDGVAEKRPVHVDKTEPVEPIVIEKPVRNVGTLIGYTAAGWTVGFEACSKCSRHANYCRCAKITAPSIVVTIHEKYNDIVTINDRRYVTA